MFLLTCSNSEQHEVWLQMTWIYEKGEYRWKHHWHNSFAGFVPGHKGKGATGKCPSDVTAPEAAAVLSRAIALNTGSHEWPERLYAVYRGVIYEAVPTRPGESYHAYPWQQLQGRPPLPKCILKHLEQQAIDEGTQAEYRKWVKRHT